MAPHVALIVPLFVMLNAWGSPTRTGLILVYAALNVPARDVDRERVLEELPWELEDAAHRRLLLPGSASARDPAHGAGWRRWRFTFIANWNEFLMALVLTATEQPRTMPLALAMFNSEFGVRWDYLSAAGVTLMLPTIALHFSCKIHRARPDLWGSEELGSS